MGEFDLTGEETLHVRRPESDAGGADTFPTTTAAVAALGGGGDHSTHTTPLAGDEHALLADGYATVQEIADLGGLPSQWSEGVNGDVTATVDDPAKTALTVASIAGQTADLFLADSVLTHASVVDNANQLRYRGKSFRGYPSGDNGITVTLVNNGPSLPLTATGNDPNVVVQLATDGSGNITSTVGDVFVLLQSPQAPNDLVRAFTTGTTIPTDLANESGLLTLIGGIDPGYTKVIPGGGLSIRSGDPTQPALSVIADQIASDVQLQDVARILCNGYGFVINRHGTFVGINDENEIAAQWYVNDGSDLAMQIRGAGQIDMLLVPTADPHVVGQIFMTGYVAGVTAGTLKLSAG